MDIEIRLSSAEDTPEIEILQASALKTASPSYTARQIDSLIQSQVVGRHHSEEIELVALCQDQIVGVAAGSMTRPQIAGVYVSPQFMRRSIGTQLLQAVETQMRDQGAKKSFVMSSLDAIAFYQRHGYTVIRRSGFHSEGNIWIPCVNLEKHLVQPSFLHQIQCIGMGVWQRNHWTNHPIVLWAIGGFLLVRGVGLLMSQLAR